MRTLAIGDIHGCYTALIKLWEFVQPRPQDRVVFLGDYIDRGYDSQWVVEWLINNSKRRADVYLRGNHEVMILDGRDDLLNTNAWRSTEGYRTLLSYDCEDDPKWAGKIPKAHWRFFEGTTPFYETERHIFVHGCIDPELDMSEQPDWMLYWETLDQMKPHRSGKTVVCGHTCQGSGRIKDVGFAICIDTGAAVRGWLTCLDIDSLEYWQVNEDGQRRGGRLRGMVEG